MCIRKVCRALGGCQMPQAMLLSRRAINLDSRFVPVIGSGIRGEMFEMLVTLRILNQRMKL
jgi:hypothetical protein